MVVLPSKPTTLSGSYVFTVPAQPAWSLSLNASLTTQSTSSNFNIESNNDNDININNDIIIGASSSAIVGSPQNFTVIGVPSPSRSVVTCYSGLTQSHRWFIPQSTLSCTLTLRNASNALIHGIVQDYKAVLPHGGQIDWPTRTLVSAVIPFNLTSPAMPQASSNSVMRQTLPDTIEKMASH